MNHRLLALTLAVTALTFTGGCFENAAFVPLCGSDGFEPEPHVNEYWAGFDEGITHDQWLYCPKGHGNRNLRVVGDTKGNQTPSTYLGGCTQTLEVSSNAGTHTVKGCLFNLRLEGYDPDDAWLVPIDLDAVVAEGCRKLVTVPVRYEESHYLLGWPDDVSIVRSIDGGGCYLREEITVATIRYGTP